MSDTAPATKRNPYFLQVSPEDFKKITLFAKEKKYLPGDVIVRERTLTDTFCIIKSGRVEITKKFSDGDEMVLTTMEEGDFFGEMALLDQGPRSATVRALSESIVLELSRDDFEKLLYEAPAIAYAIMRELGKRLRETGSLLVAHLEKKNKQLSQAYLDTVHSLVNALEARDSYTRGHTTRVTIVAKAIARRLDLMEEDLFALEIGALLHDLGKIGVPDSVLKKTGPLEGDEYHLIMEHPALGELILKNVAYLERSIPSILYHHERFDGKGYPRGMAGAGIPLFGRIIAVADSFDAMISDRAYRKRMSVDRAIEQVRAESGKQFDGEIVAAFLAAYEAGELKEAIEKAAPAASGA
jgi:HD-GYP domain-containing protein (c-di-GMP phosphodiesterase class II)